MSKALIGMQLVREFVGTILLTGRIKNQSPVSAVLIAMPECGKTSIMLENAVPNAIAVTDVTGRGLMELCKHKPEVSHIIINDLVPVVAHKHSVKAYTFAVLNSMVEEGIQAVAFPGEIETYQYGKRAILTSLTPQLMQDGRHWWNRTGFSTRLLPFCFDHGQTLSMRIYADIEGKPIPNLNDPKVVPVRIPVAPINVIFPSQFNEIVRNFAVRKAQQLGDPKGYRRLKQYRTVTMAHALLRTWKDAAVTQEDIEFLIRIDPYIDYGRPAIL